LSLATPKLVTRSGRSCFYSLRSLHKDLSRRIGQEFQNQLEQDPKRQRPRTLGIFLTLSKKPLLSSTVMIHMVLVAALSDVRYRQRVQKRLTRLRKRLLAFVIKANPECFCLREEPVVIAHRLDMSNDSDGRENMIQV